MRIRLTKIVTTCSALILIAIYTDTVQPRSFAQTSTPGPASASDSSGTRDAEVLQELARMKARILELETQLKQKDAIAPDAKPEPGSSSADAQAPDHASLTGLLPQPSEASQSKPAKAEPFAFADWTWLNGNPRTKQPAFDSKFFTPEIRADVDYVYDFNHPHDDTIGGSSEVFRSDEVHVTQLGVGGDFHYDNVRARLMTQFGLYSETTPRNDASPSRVFYNRFWFHKDRYGLTLGGGQINNPGRVPELLKFMEAKATVSGELGGRTLTVQTIGPVSKVR
jgi:Putative beta-barrel porin-2, OmpL-like. bbp2